jgi:hypothetical protein
VPSESLSAQSPPARGGGATEKTPREVPPESLRRLDIRYFCGLVEKSDRRPGRFDFQFWNDLGRFLFSSWGYGSGRKAKICPTMINSAGARTDSVSRLARARQGLRMVAPFEILDGGPASLHLPDFIEQEHLAQLTPVKVVCGRRSVREYVKLRAREDLDLEVYSFAALCVLGRAALRGLVELVGLLKRPPNGPGGGNTADSGGDPGPVRIRAGTSRRSNWVKGWRQKNSV